MSRALFFYGTLCHLPLLEVVLGRGRAEIDVAIALLPDHLVSWVKDQPFPMISYEKEAEAQGIIVRDLREEDIARLRFYEGGFEYDLASLTVRSEAGIEHAEVFFPSAGVWDAAEGWSLDQWVRKWGGLSVRAAHEVMEHYGRTGADEIAHLLPFLRARAWAHELAQDTAPTRLRNNTSRDAVTLNRRDDGYSGFFRLDTFDVKFPRFNGTESDTVERAAFVAYDAALLLPYDPISDHVMLIEQMRYGPLLRGDPLPWVLEPIAGLVDAGEAPIEAARREAQEEAGLDLSDIREMVKVYPSPGYSTEFFHCFLGLCPLNTSLQGHHGLASENEDIRTHVVTFERAMALLDSGEINLGPLAMMLLWLAREREKLRAAF